MCVKTYHLFILVFGLSIRREDKVKLVSAKKKIVNTPMLIIHKLITSTKLK